MNIERALTIDGYMTARELLWLAERASESRVIVEIGSLFGRSTVAMAMNTTGTVYAVDNWYDLGENYHASHRDLAHAKFIRSIVGIMNIAPIECDHAEFGPVNNADFVFIDGDHNYPNIMRDISKWLKRSNLLLAGHDINDNTHPDVTRAVSELIPDYQVVLGTAIWFTYL